MCDQLEGWVSITVNDNEFSQRFELHSARDNTVGDRDDGSTKYYMAATFANDHQLKVITHGHGAAAAAAATSGFIHSPMHAAISGKSVSDRKLLIIIYQLL